MLITNLATCNYIADHKSIVIKGYTSSGKTYIACAFGREACMHLYRTRYYRVPDLLMDYSCKTTRKSSRFRGVYDKLN